MRDAHSYVVGSYTNLDCAKEAAHHQVEYRGGKYGCEVVECLEQNPLDECDIPSQVYYVESPYYGMAGKGIQPADASKRILPQT